jgi:Holliday junction resolvase RusA-like endonuclease
METVYNAFISGLPKAQPRPRMTKTGHTYNPETAREWKDTVKAHFMIHRKPQINEPVRLEALFFLPRPKRLMKTDGPVPHTVKPDADNLLKAVMDAMTEAGVWKDDALVYGVSVEKWYSGTCTGARITVKAGCSGDGGWYR